jgi:cleavage stimulation factor subunit 1
MAAEVDRHFLYQLIISQLHHDGYTGLAEEISTITLTPADKSIPKGKLDELVQAGLEAEAKAPTTSFVPTVHVDLIKGIDLDEEVGNTARATAPTNFETCWIATHKYGCTVATFSPDGGLAATGSQDTTIKLIDVNKITAQRQRGEESGVKAVVKTLYDHTHPISALDFHPTWPILGTASDTSIKFFDLKETTKRVKKEMKDTHVVRAIKFHPSGEYLLVGTEHHYLRLYEYSSRNSYISSATEQQNQHQLRINSVDTTTDGRMFVSSSDDGSIKLWDGRTLGCANSFSQAHNALPVRSAKFSRNAKYILSSGEDHVVRLWDIAAGKPVLTYKTPISKFHCPASFTFDERHILVPDGAHGLHCIDTLTQEVTQQMVGHSNGINFISAHPTNAMFITCSEDSRARFWIDPSQGH